MMQALTSETRAAIGADSATVLSVGELHKTFRVGFFRKRIEAVRGVSFDVKQGETFGLLGPNGAGKTTTIKSILRLIHPDRGSIRLFGKELSLASMQRIGYLPENPYVYQYLRAPEFLDLCGRLMGMDAAARELRSREMLELVGLAHAVDRPIGRFSKGMMQRVGLAQALLHDPELLILDEPMSGLDPIGRKQVRDIILGQRKRGKTLIFTSHVLSDVEMLCDRIAIVNRGQVVARGTLDELLRREVRRVRIQLENVAPALKHKLTARGFALREQEQTLHVTVEGDSEVNPLLSELLSEGARVIEVEPERETLEDLFVRKAMASGE
ncbi:MAG: transporter, ATP-binding protein [Myxococcaceae bacterium]|nr:transporter, ATP-binding protein [Myxococcaceae bacterium]